MSAMRVGAGTPDRSTGPGAVDLLAAAAALRWARPDLTAALADHVLDSAAVAGDRESWLLAAGWALHARSATGDGRATASDVLDTLPQWGPDPFAAPEANRLRIELALVAVGAGEIEAAKVLLEPVVIDGIAPDLRGDAFCVLARCAVEDAPDQVTEILQEADVAWSEVHAPDGDLGAAAVALVGAAAERRAGRPGAAVDVATSGLARLERARGSGGGSPSSHLAAALAAEWIAALLDGGRIDEARQGCVPLVSRLAESARPSRQLARLRLTVARATATAETDGVVDALERAVQDAVHCDAPDLESVCRSALGALQEKAGRLAVALETLRSGVAAEQRHQSRDTRFRAALAALAGGPPSRAARPGSAPVAERRDAPVTEPDRRGDGAPSRRVGGAPAPDGPDMLRRPSERPFDLRVRPGAEAGAGAGIDPYERFGARGDAAGARRRTEDAALGRHGPDRPPEHSRDTGADDPTAPTVYLVPGSYGAEGGQPGTRGPTIERPDVEHPDLDRPGARSSEVGGSEVGASEVGGWARRPSGPPREGPARADRRSPDLAGQDAGGSGTFADAERPAAERRGRSRSGSDRRADEPSGTGLPTRRPTNHQRPDPQRPDAQQPDTRYADHPYPDPQRPAARRVTSELPDVARSDRERPDPSRADPYDPADRRWDLRRREPGRSEPRGDRDTAPGAGPSGAGPPEAGTAGEQRPPVLDLPWGGLDGDSPIGELLLRSLRALGERSSEATPPAGGGGTPAGAGADRPADPPGSNGTRRRDQRAPRGPAGGDELLTAHGSPRGEEPRDRERGSPRGSAEGGRAGGGDPRRGRGGSTGHRNGRPASGPRGEDEDPARADPGGQRLQSPWATGQWLPSRRAAPEADVEPRSASPSNRSAPRSGGADPDSWLHNALAELDRVWGPPAERAAPPPAPPTSAAEGCVVAIDVARDGRRFAGKRAATVVREVADRLADELPTGARLRHEADSLSVVLPGWGRVPATDWMRRILPGLLAGYAPDDDLRGMQLRAAVHDTDGPVGAQILQRLDSVAPRPADIPSPDGRHGVSGRGPSWIDGLEVRPGSGGRRHRPESDQERPEPPDLLASEPDRPGPLGSGPSRTGSGRTGSSRLGSSSSDGSGSRSRWGREDFSASAFGPPDVASTARDDPPGPRADPRAGSGTWSTGSRSEAGGAAGSLGPDDLLGRRPGPGDVGPRSASGDSTQVTSGAGAITRPGIGRSGDVGPSAADAPRDARFGGRRPGGPRSGATRSGDSATRDRRSGDRASREPDDAGSWDQGPVDPASGDRSSRDPVRGERGSVDRSFRDRPPGDVVSGDVVLGDVVFGGRTADDREASDREVDDRRTARDRPWGDPASDAPFAQDPAPRDPARDGPAFDGPAFDGPAFDGPASDGALFDGPMFDDPASDERRADERRADGRRADGRRAEGAGTDGRRAEGADTDGRRTGDPAPDERAAGGGTVDGRASDGPDGEERARRTQTSASTEGLGLADLLAGALEAYRAI